MDEHVKDLAVKVSIRNNRILWRIKKAGFKSVAEFCRVNYLPQATINSLITFYRSPLGRDDWLPVAYSLSSALRCEPEDLWPEQLKRLRRKQLAEFTIDAPEAAALAYVPKTIDAKAYENLMSSISSRERIAVEDLMAGTTYREMGNNLGVGLERAREIEAKALRKMHHPSRLKYLVSVADSLDVPIPSMEDLLAKQEKLAAEQQAELFGKIYNID